MNFQFQRQVQVGKALILSVNKLCYSCPVSDALYQYKITKAKILSQSPIKVLENTQTKTKVWWLKIWDDWKWLKIEKCSHVSWDTSTSQIHHCSNRFTLPERKNENFQITVKISTNACFLLRRPFYTGT